MAADYRQQFADNAGKGFNPKSPDSAFDANVSDRGILLARESGLAAGVLTNAPGLDQQEQQAEERRKERGNELLQQVSEEALERTLKALELATQAAERSLDRLEEQIASIGSKIEAYDKQIEENAIELKSGTKVYFNKETKLFEKKSADGRWAQLTDDEQNEAREAARKKDGGFSSKQDREKVDKAKTDVNAAVVFLNEKRDQVAQPVDRGDIGSVQNAAENRSRIADDADKLSQSLDIVAPPALVDKRELPAVVERESTGADLFNSLSAQNKPEAQGSSASIESSPPGNSAQIAAKLEF